MKKNWKITFVFLAIFCTLVIAAFIIGISSNPPGILLCYVAMAALILAFVHNWRKVWKFLILLGTSVIGFLVFVFLHNFFYALAKLTSDTIILNHLFELLHAGCFLIAVMLCPAAFLVSAVGSAVMSFKIALTSVKMSRKN